MRAIVSIHDVMPETLAPVRALVNDLQARGHQRITLLVVPGRAWDAHQLELLAEWSAAGLELAAHGWMHRVERIRGAFHRIHATLISRDVAEHLALAEDDIVRLMQASADWFPRHGLPAPVTYVPPAWALGRIRRERLRDLPYRHVEVLRGLLDTRTGAVDRLPLAGFEADTRTRAVFLRSWNRLQIRRAQRLGRPLRVAIHPWDVGLRLGRDLENLLDNVATSSARAGAKGSNPA